MIRLDKYIASALLVSRSGAHGLIKSGRISCGGKIIKDIGFPVDGGVSLDGEALTYREFRYLMLNKPDGCISATEDKKGEKTVLDLLDERYKNSGLFPVGRLDKDTVGLLILTNDGGAAHFLLSPKRHVYKKYYLETDLPLEESDIEAFQKGVVIGKEKYLTMPARLEITGERCGYLSIREGKFHQIKFMLNAVGKNVIFLERVQFGEILLDRTLARGEYRELTEKETEILKSNV